MGRVCVILGGAVLVAASGCAPTLAPFVAHDLGLHMVADDGGDPSGSDTPFDSPGVAYREGADESELDVWVTFTGAAWDRARDDPGWATDTVIAILGRYQENPEAYFATLPVWATQGMSWRSRIDVEIRLHCLAGDNDIHFSQWWIWDVWPADTP